MSVDIICYKLVRYILDYLGSVRCRAHKGTEVIIQVRIQ